MPSFVLSWKSPFEVFMQKPPDYAILRVIGCLCDAMLKTSDKLAPRALKCILLGYPYAKKAYKLYDLDSHRIVISRDVVFKEHIFPHKQNNSENFPLDFSLPSVYLSTEKFDSIPHFP